MAYIFKNEPYQHQRDVLLKSWNKEAWAWFLEMGTGKTFISLNNAGILFERELINWLLQNVMQRVVTVRRTYLENMRTIITNGLNDGKTIVEISKDLQSKINQRGFYRWQALRIARTETTAAANYAALQSGISSRIIMDKVWISATDSRTRTLKKDKYDHLAMNGKRVPQNEYFKVPTKGGFENMAFAGDPKGKAGNVINCRCANALVPRRDKDGNLVRF